MTKRAPSPLWRHFRPGMTAGDLVKASGKSMSTVSKFLLDAKLERRKHDGGYRYYLKGSAPASGTPADAPMQPLRRAFTGPAVIPVREGGRIVPVNLNRGYLQETTMADNASLQQLKDAKRIAKAHGLFVVERGGRYLLYREQQPTNVLVGTRNTPEALRAFVRKVANVH